MCRHVSHGAGPSMIGMRSAGSAMRDSLSLGSVGTIPPPPRATHWCWAPVSGFLVVVEVERRWRVVVESFVIIGTSARRIILGHQTAEHRCESPADFLAFFQALGPYHLIRSPRGQ